MRLQAYAAGATGAAAPIATYTGPATGIFSPRAVAVIPPMKALSRALAPAALDRHYAARAFEVLGKPPVCWRLIAGRLGVGLRLARSGWITGTPRRPGVYHLSVRVTDSSKHRQTATARLTIEVIDPPTITAITPAQSSRTRPTRVTITGTRFARGTGTTVFMFGGRPAANVSCPTGQRCTAIPPAHRPDTVTVTAIVHGIASTPTPSDTFRHLR